MSIISLGVPHVLMLFTLQILIFIFHSSTKPNPVSSQPENYLTKYPHLFILSSTSYISFKTMHSIFTIKKMNSHIHCSTRKNHTPPSFQSIISVLFLIPICMRAWLVVGTTHEKKNYAWSPLVCTTLKNFWGSLNKVDHVCVETIFDGCSCVPDDLPYHSHTEGHVLCLSFFQNLVPPSTLIRNRTIGRKEQKHINDVG